MVDTEWVIRIVLLGIAHWLLAGVLLNDLATREKVFGNHKAVWAVLIIFVTCLGSIIYLIFHPQIFNPNDDDDWPYDD